MKLNIVQVGRGRCYVVKNQSGETVFTPKKYQPMSDNQQCKEFIRMAKKYKTTNIFVL